MRILAVALALCATSACATGWQKNSRKVLEGVHAAGVAGHSVAKGMCSATLNKCIAEGTNPCPDLEKCADKRTTILKSLETLQRSVVLGILAVEAGEKNKAEDYVRAAQKALAEVLAVLEAWK